MNYDELDRRILAAIQQGRNPLYAHPCWTEAQRIADATGREDYRVTDGRLQALRKSGKIFYKQGKWHIPPAAQDSEQTENT